MAVFLMFLNQCSGSLALITYAATIFEMAAEGDRTAYQLPPAIAPIVLATVQLIGTIVSLVLVDRVGRRILLIVSCVGVANGYLTLAAYVQFRPQEATAGAGGSAIALLLPLVSLSFSILLASLGLLTVPFVVMAEILPAKVHPAVRCCFSMAQHTASSLIRLFFWSPFGVTSCGLGTLEPQQIAPFVRACVCVCPCVSVHLCMCTFPAPPLLSK